jgi:hypothetical protein
MGVPLANLSGGLFIVTGAVAAILAGPRFLPTAPRVRQRDSAVWLSISTDAAQSREVLFCFAAERHRCGDQDNRRSLPNSGRLTNEESGHFGSICQHGRFSVLTHLKRRQNPVPQ